MGSHFEMKTELNLCEDREYRCIDKIQKHGRFISVRPTKSCVRALQEYFINMSKNLNLQKIKVEVVNNKGFGRLLFPTNSDFQSHMDTRPPSVFEFTIDRYQRYFSKGYQKHQGAIEIIKQKSKDSIESIGRIHYKARVKASDDIFATTKSRMQEAEKLHRKKCAKIIEDTNMFKSRYPKTRFEAMPGLMVTGKTSPAQSRQEKELPVIALNSKISDRPLKERLIHLLAIGKTLGVELKKRIINEGVKPGEMNAFHHILRDISNVRDKRFSALKKTFWSQVNLNWPFYTEEERTSVAKNKPPASPTPSPPSDASGSSSNKSEKTPNSMPVGSPTEIARVKKRAGSPISHEAKKDKIEDETPMTSSKSRLTLSDKVAALKEVTKNINISTIHIDQSTEEIVVEPWPELPTWPLKVEINCADDHVAWAKWIDEFVMPVYDRLYAATNEEKIVLENIRQRLTNTQEPNHLLELFFQPLVDKIRDRGDHFNKLHHHIKEIIHKLDEFYEKCNGKYDGV